MSKEKEKQVTMYELRKSEEQLRICSGLEAQMRHSGASVSQTRGLCFCSNTRVARNGSEGPILK